MTTAVRTSLSASVYLDGDLQQSRYFSLSADESIRQATRSSQQQQPLIPVSTVTALNPPNPCHTPEGTLASPVPMNWQTSPVPPSIIPPRSRPLTEPVLENEFVLSPSSQPSRHSTSVHSPQTTAFQSRRSSYDPAPFGSSAGEPHDRRAHARMSTGSDTRDEIAVTANQAIDQTLQPASDVPIAPKNNMRRYHLHIRQQPRAVRAGPDGRDRRAVDPPPIVQLLMDDFDPDSPEDVAEMMASNWVVYCRLLTKDSPETDVTSRAHFQDGRGVVEQNLLGTYVASPHHTSDDPDPATMVPHPVTQEAVTAPPSPTSRFLPVSTIRKPQRQPHQIPCAFFIFADISIRRAGEYRLKFLLMRMGAEQLVEHAKVPVIDEATSEIFRAVNAKDFDQVKPSSELVKGLLDRGAGFPLKMKKGAREGTKRRAQLSGEGSEDNESDGFEIVDT